MMSGDLVDSAGPKNLIYFKLPAEAFDPIEEFDRREPIGSLDDTILSHAGTERTEQANVVSRFEVAKPRIRHALDL